MRNIIPQFVVAFTVILSSFLSLTEIHANPRDDLYKKAEAVKAEIDKDVDSAYKVIEAHLDSLKPQMHACLAQQSGQKEGKLNIRFDAMGNMVIDKGGSFQTCMAEAIGKQKFAIDLTCILKQYVKMTYVLAQMDQKNNGKSLQCIACPTMHVNGIMSITYSDDAMKIAHPQRIGSYPICPHVSCDNPDKDKEQIDYEFVWGERQKRKDVVLCEGVHYEGLSGNRGSTVAQSETPAPKNKNKHVEHRASYIDYLSYHSMAKGGGGVPDAAVTKSCRTDKPKDCFYMLAGDIVDRKSAECRYDQKVMDTVCDSFSGAGVKGIRHEYHFSYIHKQGHERNDSVGNIDYSDVVIQKKCLVVNGQVTQKCDCNLLPKGKHYWNSNLELTNIIDCATLRMPKKDFYDRATTWKPVWKR